MMSDKNSVVAIFDSHERAEDAIRELREERLRYEEAVDRR